LEHKGYPQCKLYWKVIILLSIIIFFSTKAQRTVFPPDSKDFQLKITILLVKLTSCTRLNHCRVCTATATAELGFQERQSSTHSISKTLVANGTRSELNRFL
jgi:antibiotic biosynthesis monooxygenase (ABM) superfamily enzyme